MNTKPEEMKNMTPDNLAARDQASCCGGSTPSADPGTEPRQRPDAEQQPSVRRGSAKDKSKGCCCSDG